MFSSMCGRCLGSAVGRTSNPSAPRRPPWFGLHHKYSRAACSQARCVRRRMTDAVPPAPADVVANDSSAGGLSADDAPMHSRQTAMSCSERSESAKAAGVARTLAGRHTWAPSSSEVTAAVMASKELSAATELRSMTGGWLRAMGRSGWIQAGVVTAALSGC